TAEFEHAFDCNGGSDHAEDRAVRERIGAATVLRAVPQRLRAHLAEWVGRFFLGHACYPPDGEGSGPRGIIRALARDDDIVHVTLAHARARDAHELGLLVQLLQGLRTHIAHGGAQAAAELVQHGRRRALVRYLAFDAFGHELERVLDVLLEVAVGGSARHGA